MDSKTYTITLADGTVLDNLKLNGNNFISNTPINADIFNENCSPVIISDGVNSETYDNMELVQITEQEPGKYWFVLRELSASEYVADLARNYTNEKLNSLPSNAPTKTVSFDGGIYSVGNNVVNGQVSACVIKGQTWTNRAGVGDTSPQTVSNLDITKTYLLINDAGANVTIDTIDTPTPVKLTGDTEFDFVWASGKIALYELSAEETALDASVLGQKYHYVSDTKSTNSVRLRSVNSDETKESIAYVNLPPGEELRSLPNGTKDEVDLTEGRKIQRINEIKTQLTPYTTGDTENYKAYRTLVPVPGLNSQSTPYTERNLVFNGKFIARVGGPSFNIEDSDNYYRNDGTYVYVKLPNSVDPTGIEYTLIYQLAQPIITKLPAQAPLQVFENGTVYVEPIGPLEETTLPTVEIEVPTGTSNKFGVASHDYDGAAADWVLTSNESKCKSLLVTNAGGAANIIAPDKPGLTFTINNKSGQAITIKKSGGTGVTVTAGKKVTVQHFGTDYEAISSEI